MTAVVSSSSTALGSQGNLATVSAPARWSRRVTVDLIAALDMLSLLAGAGLSTLLHRENGAFGPGQAIISIEICLLTAVAAHFVFRKLGHYNETRVPAIPVRVTEVAVVLFLVFSTVQSVAFTLGITQAFPRTWQPVALAAGALLLIVSRRLVRAVITPYAQRGAFDSSLAVYGAGSIARKVADHVARPGSGLRLVAVYDDRAASGRVNAEGLTVSGGLADLIASGRADRFDDIIIALPQTADRRIADIARRLEHLPVRIRICTHVSSDLVDPAPPAHAVSSVGPVGLLDLKTKPLTDWAPFIKRLEDAVLGSLALLAFALPMAVIALCVKLDSPGPVFFRQKRNGLNHRVIEVLKFRTMYVRAEDADVRQAQRDDPRVTRVGRFLRRTSLDELPQLINIVKGDMALVGPRPHALVHNEYYGEMLERYANRHQVKPGLTGWAQINGFRGETQNPEDMRKRVEFDLHYIDHWSLLLDLYILLATPIYGFISKNAY